MSLSGAERLADHRAEPGQVDDDLVNPGLRQRTQVPRDERPAAHLDERLGEAIRQRPHAFAATGGQQHRFHAAALARAFARGNSGTTRDSRNALKSRSSGNSAAASRV